LENTYFPAFDMSQIVFCLISVCFLCSGFSFSTFQTLVLSEQDIPLCFQKIANETFEGPVY